MIYEKLKLLFITGFLFLIAVFQVIFGQWKQMEGLAGGNFIDITINENGTVYAATTSGIYISADHGVNWTETDSAFPEGDVSALTVVGNRITVYTLHDGKFFSTDNGLHWTPVKVQGSDNQTFSVIEGKGGELIAQGYHMSSRSTDGGETWSDVEGLPNYGGTEMVIAQNGDLISPNKNSSKGIIRSTDHGVSWSDPDTSLGIIRLIDKKNDSVYIALGEKGVFVSTDEGKNWIQTSTLLPSIYYNFSCMVAGASGDLFFGTGEGVYKTSDDGKSWLPVNIGLANTSIRCLIVDSTGIIYAATYGGGVFTSSDNCSTWVTPISGLLLTSVYSLTVNQTGEIFAGTFHSGIFRSIGSEPRLIRSFTGLPSNISIVSLVSNKAGEVMAATDSGLFKSSNNGESWALINSDMAEHKRVNELAVSGTGNIVTSNNKGVFCSADNGESWTAANHGQSFPSILAFATDGDSIIYAATYTGVLRSTNAGMKWVSVSNGLPDTIVTSIAVTRNHAVLAGTRDLGIFRSVDSGGNWLQVGKNLPENLLFKYIVTDSNGNCFIGSDNGKVMVSNDDGLNWIILDTGLKDETIYSLAISSGKLFAGTESSGIWYRAISEMTGIQKESEQSIGSHLLETKIISTHCKGSPVTISFTLKQKGTIECSVYSMSGIRIESLVNGHFMPGDHRIFWNPGNKANGCYIVNIRTGKVSSRKVISILK